MKRLPIEERARTLTLIQFIYSLTPAEYRRLEAGKPNSDGHREFWKQFQS
jgi:hypothetical protein